MSGAPEIEFERSFSQEDFNLFAELSGDSNPIHIDPAFAATTRFERTVAHGLLLCSVLRGLIERLAPGGRMVSQSLIFPAPTYADETMRFTARVSGQYDGHQTIDLEVSRRSDQRVTCTGHCVVKPCA